MRHPSTYRMAQAIRTTPLENRPTTRQIKPSKMPHNANRTTLEAYSAFDLPSIEARIRYFHTEAGYPVRSTWLKFISAGNYSSWPGLTLANATKYCPSTTATIMGHLVQKRQGVRSTQTKLTATIPPYPNSLKYCQMNSTFM